MRYTFFGLAIPIELEDLSISGEKILVKPKFVGRCPKTDINC